MDVLTNLVLYVRLNDRFIPRDGIRHYIEQVIPPKNNRKEELPYNKEISQWSTSPQRSYT